MKLSYSVLVSVLFSCLVTCAVGFRKVLVPSIHTEYDNVEKPIWLTEEGMKKYDYEIFLYQRTDPNKPNYIATNRGAEAGVYYRYIVDHYDDFPDVAIFAHAHPEDHQKQWWEFIGCISPNATYINFNFDNSYRWVNVWSKAQLWVEQCWRDVLKIAWGLEGEEHEAEFLRRLPVDNLPGVSFVTSHQFIISRDQIHKRPLEVWRKLLLVLGEQDQCHKGEPDYEHLYTYVHQNHEKVGPEPTDLCPWGEKADRCGTGRLTQAHAAEHLAHVIFGFYDMDMTYPDMNLICQNYLPSCPSSPCTRTVAGGTTRTRKRNRRNLRHSDQEFHHYNSSLSTINH
mmetsp:Transcript_33370/g.56022  ORF Transcript_33370/g.56022 Transcript_33370/m.56022 type:complete len:340 (+) Transcript_33370:47-1066(+)